jgi:hypothetical protein
MFFVANGLTLFDVLKIHFSLLNIQDLLFLKSTAFGNHSSASGFDSQSKEDAGIVWFWSL